MAHPKATRDKLRRHYVEGLPLNGAAVSADVSYDTARDWKRQAKAAGDDWDTARAAYRISGQGVDELNRALVEDFSRQVIATTRELQESRIKPADKAVLLAQLADAYAKFSKAFGRVNPEYGGLAVALEVLKLVVEVLRRDAPTLLPEFEKHLDAVGAEVTRRYAA